jgi:hypothetical protein
MMWYSGWAWVWMCIAMLAFWALYRDAGPAKQPWRTPRRSRGRFARGAVSPWRDRRRRVSTPSRADPPLIVRTGLRRRVAPSMSPAPPRHFRAHNGSGRAPFDPHRTGDLCVEDHERICAVMCSMGSASVGVLCARSVRDDEGPVGSYGAGEAGVLDGSGRGVEGLCPRCRRPGRP